MPEQKNEFSTDFANLVEDWRRKHHLREDEPLLVCLDLFRLHQEHWDSIRRKELPSFSDLRDSLLQIQEQATILQRLSAVLLEELRQHPRPKRFVEPTVAGLILTAAFSVLTGILIGSFIL